MTDTTLRKRNLTDHFVVLTPTLGAEPVEVTDTLYQDLDARYDNFSGASLVSFHSFAADWSVWEMHPSGDEVVCLVNGDADLVLATPEGETSCRLSEPGDYVVVPRGTWHTARVRVPTSMWFITPGEGTENRETLPWEER